MDDTGAGHFDVDEWAEPYRRDPAAFEARRQAVLMLGLSRGEPRQRDAARAAMARYERAADGLDGAGAVHAGEVEFDESADSCPVQVSVPVMSDGKAVGAATLGVDIGVWGYQ